VTASEASTPRPTEARGPGSVLVTGGAGFIGSNLVDRLLALGHAVTVYDNLSTGQPEFLDQAARHPAFRLVRADLLDLAALRRAAEGQDLVFHLAANADVRHGTEHPRRDLEQNTIATHNLLEAMRLADVRRIAFSSTGSIYGEPDAFPTPEDCPFPDPASIYNLGTDEYCTVDESLGWICAELGVDPRRSYTGGERGWVGDSPFIFLDCSRIRRLGWRPKRSIRESLVSILRSRQRQPWALEARR
jgi:nucleoside-diphosphate-sugar epimerase